MLQKNYFCNDDEALFKLLERANNRENVDEKDILKVKAALQAFVFKPDIMKRKMLPALKAKIQAVASSTDFPINITNAFNMIVDEQNYDMGWEAAFQDVPKDSNKQFWEIVTGHNFINFRRMPEGARLRVEEISGELVLAYVDYYGAALGFTDAMIRYRQIAVMFDKIKAFRDSFYVSKADVHYLILATAAALHIMAWQAGTTTLARDIATLNLAAATLGDTNKDKGYPVTGTTPLLLYASPFDESRIEGAYRATNDSLVQGAAGVPAISGRPVRRIYTYNQYVTRNHPIMVLPGQKLQKHEDLAPLTYNAPDDILTLNRMQSVWSIYGAACADDEQVMRVDLV